MRTCKVFKASPIVSEEPVEGMIIEILTSIDLSIDETSDLKKAFRVYETDAGDLAEALLESLPQGTMDRLITQLMGNRAAQMGYKGRSE